MKMRFTDKEYTFIYYASNTSGECRKFTPELVKFYGENKKSASIGIILRRKKEIMSNVGYD